MSFTLETNHSGGPVIVRVGNALDFRNAEAFQQACKKSLQEGTKTFIFDFSETGMLDSTGLGSIFKLHHQVSRLNGKVVLASLSQPVQVVIQMTRAYKVFPHFASVEAALASLAKRGAGPAHPPTQGVLERAGP